jgi:hypothetical protein
MAAWSDRLGVSWILQFVIKVVREGLQRVRSIIEEALMVLKVGVSPLLRRSIPRSIRKSSSWPPLASVLGEPHSVLWALESIPMINGRLLVLQ